MICPTPPIFVGETWDVLCGQTARGYHQTQVYFSAVVLLLRQTKAIGGNVETHCFGVSLRYTPRGEAGSGAVRRWGGGGPKGRRGAVAGGWGALCAGPAGRDDGEAERGHGAAKGARPASLQTQRRTLQTHPTGPPSHLPLATIPLSCGTPDLEIFLQNVNERMRYHRLPRFPLIRIGPSKAGAAFL